jgi:hypothetical protein
MVQIRQDIAQIQRNIDEQTVTNTRTVALIAYRTDEKAKLQQDRDKFEYEQKEITPISTSCKPYTTRRGRN